MVNGVSISYVLGVQDIEKDGALRGIMPRPKVYMTMI